MQPLIEGIADDWRPWVEQLAGAVLEMGEQGSNVVLRVLGDEPPRRGAKYPPGHLRFAEGDLRAYYHSHPKAPAGVGEHGHFHLFVRESSDAPWGHLAGLSMDYHGQPLDWFTVNLWVSGGVWHGKEVILDWLGRLRPLPDGSAEERWLQAMVALFASDLLLLLEARDDALARHAHQGGRGLEEARQDRNIYFLSRSPVRLMARLDSLGRKRAEVGRDFV